MIIDLLATLFKMASFVQPLEDGEKAKVPKDIVKEIEQNGQMAKQQQNGTMDKGKEEVVATNGVNKENDGKTAKATKAVGVMDWDYNEHGGCGPAHWLHICGCAHLGKCQSPIELRLSQMRILHMDSQPLCLVNYRKPLAGQLVNNGCSVQFLADPQIEPPEIYGGGLDQHFRFVQYHFHWAQNDNEGSEHTLGGLRYPAELHLVHQGIEDPSKLAVLGIFLKLEETNGRGDEEHGEDQGKYVFGPEEMEALKKLTEPDSRCPLGQHHSLASKLPPHCSGSPLNKADPPAEEHFVSSFVRYSGSLTTPPCTENVHWTVFTDPLSISRAQLSLLRNVKDCRGKVIIRNYRPVQKLCGREVLLIASCREAK